MELQIYHLYPDVLNLYGDRGNVLCLRRRLEWRGIGVSVTELPMTGRKLLIIDEFPYMVQGNSSIPSVLQNLWDELLQHEQVMLVLCGSSLSFIERELLAEKNPLYGRACCRSALPRPGSSFLNVPWRRR